MSNGIFGGSLLILLGGAISKYTGLLLVKVSDYTGRDKYDDMALALFNKRTSVAVSVLNVMSLLSFVIAYMVLVSELNQI